MVEAQLFLQLLMSLFADLARLDRTGELFDRRVGEQVGEIIFAFSGRTTLTHHPDLLTRKMLGAHIEDALRWAIGDSHPHSFNARRQTALGATPPTDLSPLLPGPCGPRPICCRGYGAGERLPRPATGKNIFTIRR